MKTPAQCLATVRKANGRLTIIRQGIENHSDPQLCHLINPQYVLFFMLCSQSPDCKSPVLGMAVWDSIHTRNDHVP